MARLANRLKKAALSLPLMAGLGAGPARAVPACEAPGPEVPVAGIVSEVIDGDTFVLDDGTEVRLVGMQAPKLALGREGMSDWPFSHQSYGQLLSTTRGKPVKLWSGGLERDRYGRRLAQAWIAEDADNPVWIQGAMVEGGFARVYSFDDNRACVRELLALEKQAREAGRGLWALESYAVLDADDPDLRRSIGDYGLVEGRVFQVAEVHGRAFLNFSADWNKDFTVTVPKKSLRLFRREGFKIDRYEGRLVRVRGWIRSWNGPLIDVTHPEQIEVLE